MKKMFLSLALVVSAMAMNAQTLIKPTLTAGKKALYETSTKITVSSPMAPGAGSENSVTSTATLEVKEANANGALLEYTANDIKANGDNASEAFAEEMSLNAFPLQAQTDANGKLTKVLNAEEAAKKVQEAVKETIRKVYKENPMAEQQAPLAKALEAVGNQYTAEKITENLATEGMIALWGKTITSGMTEDADLQGLKVKKTYTLMPMKGNMNVTVNFTLNMTKDEVKEFFREQMTKAGAGEQFDQMWPMLEQNGMAEIKLTGSEVYSFNKEGWATSVKSVATTEAMGATTKIEATTTLK